jgi:septal ring factor EnvC (AmiA/AmiB activator)
MTLSITWAYVKKYWSFAVLVLAMVFGYFLLRKTEQDVAEQIKKIQDAHEKELNEILRAREEERQRLEENSKKLQAALESIQKQYETAKKELDAATRQKIQDIVEEHGDDPVALAQKLSEVTGFTVIMPQG